MLSILLGGIFFLGSFQGGRADCSAASVTTVGGTHAPKGKICPGDLIFEEEFDTLDLTTWSHEINIRGGGNGEFEWYTNSRNNSFAADSVLHIRPTLVADELGEQFLYSGHINLEGCTDSPGSGCEHTGSKDHIINPIKSARMLSVNSFFYKYGKLEARAKIPAGDWLWPAIWMMPRYSKYSGWPTSGEIDIMESRGNRELVSGKTNIGTHQVGSTLHFGPDYKTDRYYYTHFDRNNDAGWDTNWHKYQVLWTPDKITFSIDGSELGTISPPAGGFWQLGELQSTGLDNPWKDNKMAPFDQEFYIILNLAIGATNGYFPDGISNPGGKPWKNSSPRAITDFWEGNAQWLPTWKRGTDDSHLQVDYIRVWAL